MAILPEFENIAKQNVKIRQFVLPSTVLKYGWSRLTLFEQKINLYPQTTHGVSNPIIGRIPNDGTFP
jgi:hypothetical protein